MLPRSPVLKRADGSVVACGDRSSEPDDEVQFIGSHEIDADGSVERALGVAQQNAPKIMDDLVKTSLSPTLPAETRIKAAGLVLSYGLGLPSRSQTLDVRKLTKRGLEEQVRKVFGLDKDKEKEDE